MCWLAAFLAYVVDVGSYAWWIYQVVRYVVYRHPFLSPLTAPASRVSAISKLHCPFLLAFGFIFVDGGAA